MLTEVERTASAARTPLAPTAGGSSSEQFLRSLGVAVLSFLLLTGGISLIIRSGSLLSPRAQVVDYRVVACAERVVLQHGDVYRTAALRDCEHGLAPEANEPVWSVTPFALPPYSAALLVPLGLLDFQLGRAVWFVALVLALCLTIAALAQIVERSAVGIALIVIPTFGLVNLFYGETVLFAVAGVALGAWAIQRGRPLAAAIAVAFALIEPAIGLPAFAGLFALAPRARGPLLACAAVLGVIGVAALGFGANREYALTFIPAHEHSEIFARDQYSLTRLAYVMGANEHVAATLGSVSYVLMLALGIVAGRRLGRRMGVPALYVLVPLAFSMLGGPFVHDYEVGAALLAAIILARDSVLARVTVGLLSIVWGARWQHNFVPAVAGAAGVALLYLEGSPVIRAGYVAAASAAVLCVNMVLPKSPERPVTVVGTPRPAVTDSDLSSRPWEWRIRLAPGLSVADSANEIEKLPLWFALMCLPFALARKKRAAASTATGLPADVDARFPAITNPPWNH